MGGEVDRKGLQHACAPEQVVLRNTEQVKGDNPVQLGGARGKVEDKLVQCLLRQAGAGEAACR